MKRYDITIVRFLPFILFVLFGVNTYCASHQIDITITFILHGNSAIYALALYLISLANHHYHCVWNRAMYIFLIGMPVFNFADAVFNFIPTQEAVLAWTNRLWILTALITAFLAIRHCIQASKRRLDNGGK